MTSAPAVRVRGPGIDRELPAPGPYLLGRGDEADLRVPGLAVSRRHALLVHRDGVGWVLEDLGSAGGTWVDGRRLDRWVVAPRGRVRLGDASGGVGLEVAVAGDVDASSERSHPSDVDALEVTGLVVEVAPGRRLLDGISLTLRPGELVAVLGPTGAGKSTLVRAMTGARRPEGGGVAIGGRDLYGSGDDVRRQVGYVPQEDILHVELTPARALDYGARIRFPITTTAEERGARITAVLEELGLSEHADTPIHLMSGGQRKRTSVALELLSSPPVIVLDEPTSGLDPGYEQKVMELLRTLADAGRMILVVTHSVASLELCDRVLFLGAGGRQVFLGTPAEAADHFGTGDYPAIFRRLEEPPTGASRPDLAPGAPAEADGPGWSWAPWPVWRSQAETVLRRQLAVLHADRRNLLYLAVATAIPALLMVFLVPSGALGGTGEGARTLLCALVVSAVSMGAANAIREIVKERPLYLRERAVGLDRTAYLAGKMAAVAAVTVAQCVVLVVLATSRADGPSSANLGVPVVELAFDVALAGLAAVALGLLLSALVSSSEKGMALVAVVFIVEWMFSGVAADLTDKPVLRFFAGFTSARWGMASASSSVHLFDLEGSCNAGGAAVDAAGRTLSCDPAWQAGILHWAPALGLMAVLTVLCLAAAEVVLATTEPSGARGSQVVRAAKQVTATVRRAASG